MYQNLKIAITDEVHLKEVCDVLESMGYQESMFTPNKNTAFIVTYESGSFTDWGKFDGGAYNWGLTTLTDLLALRDKQFMEKIHA